MHAQGQENRVLAALAYPMGIVAVVILATDMKNQPFMRFHAWQGLFYNVAWLVAWVSLTIVAQLPVAGWMVALFLTIPLQIAWLGLSLYYAFAAFQGREFAVPGINTYARQYAGQP